MSQWITVEVSVWKVGTLDKKLLLGSRGARSIEKAVRLPQADEAVCNILLAGQKATQQCPWELLHGPRV